MPLSARDIMQTEVISVPATMDLRDLAKLFLEKRITGAPVLDEAGQLAGVVSQTDLVYYNLVRGDELVMDSHYYHSARVEGRHVPPGFQFEDCNSGCVADVMTPVVHSVTERASVESVARLMTRNHIHRVIVRRGGTVAGIISALDVLQAQGIAPPSARIAKNAKNAKKKAAGRRKRSVPARGKRKSGARRRTP